MTAPLSAKDFTTSQEVRWCPGCGDYAILKTMTKVLADSGASKENTAFISGIGCSSRFPYYLDTYGFHTIHGRAPAVATGLKLANPELDVWVVTGDGDGLSIGGNHLLHALRRNIGIKILLFNNEIYGLTKGQYSPTSRPGTKTPSSPAGSLDTPLSAGAFAIGAGAHFFARAIDTDKKGLADVLHAAQQHTGTALVEIFQNCIVYNDNVFASFTDKATAADTQLRLQHGEPMLFGTDSEKGLSLNTNTLQLEVINARKFPERVMHHDVHNKTLAQMLIALDLPIALGVLYEQDAASFEKTFYEAHNSGFTRTGRVADALRRTSTWTVK